MTPRKTISKVLTIGVPRLDISLTIQSQQEGILAQEQPITLDISASRAELQALAAHGNSVRESQNWLVRTLLLCFYLLAIGLALSLIGFIVLAY
jgi:hypothetical protein